MLADRLRKFLLKGAPEAVGTGGVLLLVYRLVERLLEADGAQLCLSGDAGAVALVAVAAWVMYAYRQPPPGPPPSPPGGGL